MQRDGVVRLGGLTLLLLTTALAVPVPPAEAAAPIAGTYECVGDSAGGGKYKGTVTIKQTGETYELQWSIGSSTHIGVGIIEANRLCCSWATSIGGKLVKGVVVYQIGSGQMTGKWAQYPGGGKIFRETLTLKKK